MSPLHKLYPNVEMTDKDQIPNTVNLQVRLTLFFPSKI